ncbi:MAG: MATE family efflux transporter [Lachnospiraceae bacterium]|nr:MATE family efflux transporter [Lachnospiraceae bacterium]
MWLKREKRKTVIDLTEGPIMKGMVSFAVPLFLGQLLQQFYSMADAWVVGNFADNDAFAAVSSAGSIIFLITGFFNGIGIGGGVIISRYVGAKNEEYIKRSIHTNFLFGLLASVLSTIVGMLLVPKILVWMKVPASVLPDSKAYFGIYFAGVSTVIMYNICMSILRALGDSVRPLYYLAISSIVNVVLDLLFVAVFRWGVAGAAIATVISQGISALLCIVQMCRRKDEITRLQLREIKWHGNIMLEVIRQGLPTGIQNSVISIGNIVVQTNINSFGAFAMSGHGAYARIEGFVFLPIMSMSMTLPTFISQNLGAKKAERAKRGAFFGITFGMLMAEAVGVLCYFGSEYALRIFVDTPEAILFGRTQAKVVSLFFFLLAFSHCAAGVLRGCGKAIVPMITMLAFWCGVRILYVTQAIKIFPQYQTICWAYPLTWTLSSIVFLVFLLKSDWTNAWERQKNR